MTQISHPFVLEDAFLKNGELIVTFNVPQHLWDGFATLVGPMILKKPAGEEITVTVTAANLFTHCFGEERAGGFIIGGGLTPSDVPLKSTLQRI